MALRFNLLNRVSIKAIPIGGKLTEHGIIVTRTIKGDLRWSVSIMVDGRRIHKVIGVESEGVTREHCERAIQTYKTKAREGRLDLPVGRKSHPPFAERASAYLERLETTGGKNLKAKRQHIEQLFVPAFGTHRADRVTTDMIQDYVRDRLALGLKQATVNRELATLSHLFRRMVKWGWMRTDDVPEIRKGPEPRKRIVVLSDGEASRLMEAAVIDSDPWLWLFVAFGLNTAMRHGEILSIQYRNIDFDARRIFVPKAKAGEREQPITPTLAQFLKRQKGQDGNDAIWVFPSRSSRAIAPHRLNMSKSFLRAVLRAGLSPKKVTPHVMRHTAITRLVKAGVDLPTIQRISGHKTLEMVLRYVHIHGSHIDAAIAAIDTAFTPDLHALAIQTAAGTGIPIKTTIL